MKFIFTLLACLLLTTAHSQELQTVDLLPPESNEYKDLSFLNNELKGKQVVMLGELTHMYGNIFEMKARVIEYLHKQLGFNTIAMESPIYDLWKMNRNGFSQKEFNEAIWGVWSGSLEFQRLVNYIEENNLKVIGFDSQVMHTSIFIEDFFDFIEAENIALKLDEDDMGITIEGILENGMFEEDDIKYSAYEQELKRIINQMDKLENNETNYYWTQFTKSLLASSQDAYFNTDEILTIDLANKNHNIRDKQMAENLLSYIDRNPDEKIVCWADNIHIINDISSIKKPIVKEFISTGTHVKRKLKNNVYSLATIHANDSIFDISTNKWEATPIKKNSFEDLLDSQNTPYLFVTSNQQSMQIPRETRLLNFVDFTEARLDQLHDGYIFFQNASLPKKEPDPEINSISNNQLELGEKIKQIELGQNVLLKGQILDQDSNDPIPFTTVILRKEEIYRVANGDGFYELPVKKSMMDNSFVEISSMGFEPKTLLLKDLNDKIYLKPRFEELAEVVVTGYLSPKTVLKKAVSNKKINHPVEPFNFYRYAKVLINENDTTALDLELISKDNDDGYLSPYVITQRVEQVKWNRNIHPRRYKTSSQFFSYRQNAIRYSNILHKRKYKKFKLNFEKSDDPEDNNRYIISFQTERNKWNYTNRSYPTNYSGKVYIDKESFAIVKVIENWETTLNLEDIEKHFKGYEAYRDITEMTIKEENIGIFSDIAGNGKYYATKYFNRSYQETLDKANKKEFQVMERDSRLFDFELENIEEIEYYEYNNKKENSLHRVEYNEAFWESFYEQQMDAI